MIAYVSGKLVHREPAFVIIEAGGIGYHIRISLNTYSRIGDTEACKLHTYFQVREDAQDLFGFADKEEKTLFEQLISISGVGGNTALTLLSSLPPKELRAAIERENVDLIKKVKGIGPKTAGRIILELKGKLPQTGEEASLTPASRAKEEAISALIALGIPKPEAGKRVDAVLLAEGPDAPVDKIIRLALKG